MSLLLRRCGSAADFWARSAAFLLRAEPENNLIIGLALGLSGSESDSRDNYWAVVEDDGHVVGAVFRTPPFPPGVTEMPVDAARLVAHDLHRTASDIPGLNGPKDTACRFAETWQKLSGKAWRVRMTQRIHVLDRVAASERAPSGALRAMRQSDLDLVREWFAGFARDAELVHIPAGLAERALTSGFGRIWDDAGAKCMVTATRETPNGRSVNAVYTPPEFRERGYATAAVTQLSREILAGGKRFCCLYTDISNPTSNSIYHAVGYRPLREDVEIVFEQ